MNIFNSTFLFCKAFFINPRAIGALVPSSPYLAKSIAACINQTKPGFILELGPGTGVVTQAILNIGIAAEKLIVVEIAHDFAEALKKEFPTVAVIEGNATQLSTLLANKHIHTIVSSLPLLSLSVCDRETILNEIQKILSPNGQFIQFTYSRKIKENFYPKNFILTNSFTVWRNIPPARVMMFSVL